MGINQDVKLFPEDEGIYTGIDIDENKNPSWVVGRIQSKKDTDKFLTDNKLSYKEAIQMGVKFTPDLRLVVTDIDELIKEDSDNFMNTYMKGYKKTSPKNTPSFTNTGK
jgi:hypothetical protein